MQCAKELERCKKESTGLYFLSLQADKYGYCPLPRTLDKATLDKRLAQYDEDVVAKQLALHWYLLDENHVPPHYVLKSLNSVDDSEYWNNVLPLVRKLLENVPLESDLCDDVIVGRSVTEWEAKRALQNEDSLSRCLWIHRQFHTGENGPFARKKGRTASLRELEGRERDERMFSTGDVSEKLKLGNLKAWMTSKLAPVDRIKKHFQLTLEEYNDEESSEKQSYLKHWEESAEELLTQEMVKISELRSQWALDGCGMGERGSIIEEMLHHAEWAHEKCRSFEGREELLTKSLALVNAENRTDEETQALALKFSGISLAVTGSSGCGKTALVAKIAQRIIENEPRNDNGLLVRPVIIRFCGTSKHSSNGLSLVRSICAQIKYNFEYEDKSVPQTYAEACECLFDLVNKHAVVLLIDSIDQMSDSFAERSRLSFLEFIDPHPDTRIIVSCLADERDPITQRWLYCFGCDTRLKESEVPRLQVPGFSGGEGTDSDARFVLGQMLNKESRQLTPNQWTYLMKQVAVEPTALYTRLAVRTVLHWRSTDESYELKETVRGLINQILEHVEREYGQLLTRYALGFITFSVGGIKNDEMEDLLTLDDDVLDSVFQYHTPNVRRLPSHVWLRLLDELSDLLVERDYGCVRWYHRQLQEVAELRYSEHKALLHSYMGMYFGDVVDINIRTARQISSQPLTKTSTVVWLPDAKINHRRCVEAPFHMIEANMTAESVKQLCDFNVICALVKSGEGFNIIRHLVKLFDRLESNNKHDKQIIVVEHYLRWLCQSMTRIAKSPVDEILTTCTTTQPLESLARCHMYEFVARGRKKKIRSFTKKSWNRGIALGGKKSFDKVMAVMEGHSGNVNSVAWHPRDDKIASASDDCVIYIWDATTGSILTTLQGHDEGVLVVTWRQDGEKIASGSSDHTVRIWDAFTGSVEIVFTGHKKGSVGAVVWSPEGKFVISGADFKDILVWNPIDGTVVLSFIEHAEGISSIYNGPSKSILSACRGGKILHWNFAKINGKVAGNIITSFEGHTSGVSCACWSPNYLQIASSSLDGTVRVWNTKSGSCVFVLQGYHRVVTSVNWSPNGERIAASYGDKIIRIWHAEEGRLLASLEGHSDYVLSLAWCPESKRLVSGAEDETVRIWDATGIDDPDEEAVVQFDGHFSAVNCVSWNASSKYLASASSDKVVLLWDIVTGMVHTSFEGHSDKVACVAWSPDDSMIATASHDTTVRIWDVETQECRLVYSGHDKVVSSVSWNSFNGTIASGSWDKTLRMWKADTGEEVSVNSAASERVLCVAWDDRGELCAFGSKDRTVRIVGWRGDDVKNILDGHSGPVNSVSWNRDSSSLVSGSTDKTVIVWNILTSAIMFAIDQHDDAVLCVTWSLDDKMIASASEDTTICVWDASAGSLICEYQGHTSPVVGIAWNGNSDVIASASMDETVRLWDSVELLATV